MQVPQRIGLYGGTFDPIHEGHIQLAQHVWQALRLDALFLIPAAVPPHKPQGTPFEHRLNMVKLAVENPAWQTSDIEAQRQGPSYTIDTLRYFAQRFPEAQCWWLLGADALQDLHHWHGAAQFHRYARFAVFPRQGYPSKPPAQLIQDFPQLHQALDLIPGEGLDSSSTEVRKNLLTRLPRRPHFLPEKVYQYIQAHHLYT